MLCDDVDRLSSAGRVLPDELRAHAGSCGRCSELLAWVARPAADPVLAPGFEDRIRWLLRAGLQPVRPLPAISTVVAGALAWIAIVVGVHTVATGAAGWRALSRWQSLGFTGLAVSVAVLAAVSLMESVRPASRRRVRALLPILLLPAGFPLLAAMLLPAGTLSLGGVSCLAAGLLVSAVAASLAWTFARRGFAMDWARAGALVGVLSAVAAIVALQVSCAALEFRHVAVWHGLAIPVSIAAGYFGGRAVRIPAGAPPASRS